MREARALPITQFVGAAEVMAALGCSRATAYEHLRRAAARKPGDRGLLRVPVEVWERYVAGPESSPDPTAWRTELNRPLTR